MVSLKTNSLAKKKKKLSALISIKWVWVVFTISFYCDFCIQHLNILRLGFIYEHDKDKTFYFFKGFFNCSKLVFLLSNANLKLQNSVLIWTKADIFWRMETLTSSLVSPETNLKKQKIILSKTKYLSFLWNFLKY